MRRETEKIYTDSQKLEAARQFGIDPESLVALEGFENFVYACERDTQKYILRLTHSIHRPLAHIRGEVTWVNDMASHGISVAPAVPSIAGHVTEIIPHEPSNTYFSAVMFEYAPGVWLENDPVATTKYWNPALFEEWGQVMAQIHNHAQYQAPRLSIQRPQWHQYDVLELDKFIPADQIPVLEAARAHLEKLHALPRSPDTYGLTHADLTQWNFNVDEGKIIVFDFDSSEYGWFVKDLAVSLYYAGASYKGEDTEELNQTFFRHLVKGYRRIRDLSDEWLMRIPDFLFLQRIILYSFCYQIWDVENLTEDNLAYLENARKIIELQEEPISVDIN